MASYVDTDKETITSVSDISDRVSTIYNYLDSETKLNKDDIIKINRRLDDLSLECKNNSVFISTLKILFYVYTISLIAIIAIVLLGR